MVDILLYYKKFVKTLKGTTFQLNPYYPCVENCLVKDKHQTICFHVDNYKLIHQDSEVNYQCINRVRDEHESVFEYGYGKMKVSQEKVHDYLGMNLYYSVKGPVNIKILYCIKEMMAYSDKAEPKNSGTKSSAAPMNLFLVMRNVRNSAKKKLKHSTIL